MTKLQKMQFANDFLKNQVNDLIHRIQILEEIEKQTDILKEEQSKLNIELDTITAKYDKASNELKKELKVKNKKITDYSKRNSKLENIINNTKGELKNTKKQLKSCQIEKEKINKVENVETFEKYNSLVKSNDKLMEKNKKLEDQFNKLESEYSELPKQDINLSDYKDIKRKYKDTLSELKYLQSTKITNELKEYQEKSSIFEKENSELKKLLKDLTKEKKISIAKVEVALASFNRLKKISNLKTELDNKESELRSVVIEKNAYKDDYKLLEKDCDEQIASRDEDINLLQNKVEELNKKLKESYSTEEENSLRDIEDAIKEMHLKTFNGEKEILNINQLNKEYRNASVLIRSLKNKLDNVEFEGSVPMTEIEKLKKENEILSKQTNSFTSKQAKIKLREEKLKNHIIRLSESIEKVKQMEQKYAGIETFTNRALKINPKKMDLNKLAKIQKENGFIKVNDVLEWLKETEEK